MKISIIIPTFQEAGNIFSLVSYLLREGKKDLTEIIVADGGSTDETREEAKKAGAKICLSPLRGRAAQMNYGANFATGEVLYFVHADTFPPEGFTTEILRSVTNGSNCLHKSQIC